MGFVQFSAGETRVKPWVSVSSLRVEEKRDKSSAGGCLVRENSGSPAPPRAAQRISTTVVLQGHVIVT